MGTKKIRNDKSNLTGAEAVLHKEIESRLQSELWDAAITSGVFAQVAATQKGAVKKWTTFGSAAAVALLAFTTGLVLNSRFEPEKEKLQADIARVNQEKTYQWVFYEDNSNKNLELLKQAGYMQKESHLENLDRYIIEASLQIK